MLLLQGRSPGDLKLMDTCFDSCNSSEKIKKTILLEEKTLSLDSRLKTEQACHTNSISHSVYADSNGFIGEETDTFHTLGMSAVADDKTEKGENKARKQTDGWYTCSRFL